MMLWLRALARTSPIRVGLLLVLLCGCAHYAANAPLTSFAPQDGYRFDTAAPESATNTDSLFICLTFSGGGMRAAALAYGVMERLRATQIASDGVNRSLLDEVDCISGVSAGSLPAAYYGLFGERFFTDFRARVLERDLGSELFARVLNPLNLIRLTSAYFGTGDLLAEHLDRTVFEGQTFEALVSRRVRPFIILNATNVATGDRFEFTQDQFDFLGSDLSVYPVARAVAASMALPVLVTPLTLRNHESPAGYRPPGAYVHALENYSASRARYEWARARMMYLEKQQRPYVHLMDGVLADNLGLRAVDAAYREVPGFIFRRVNSGSIQRLVIIVVNARTAPQEEVSRSERSPGLLASLQAPALSMGNYSFETVELMKEFEYTRRQAAQTARNCQRLLEANCPSAPRLPVFEELKTCFIEVNFNAIRDPIERQRFLSMPTTFDLSRQDVDALIAVGGALLEQSPGFQQLLRSLRERDPVLQSAGIPDCA